LAKFLISRSLATAIAGVLLVFAIDTIAEPVFRWKDKQGNPVFSDRAPTPNQPFVIIGGLFRPAGSDLLASAVSANRHQQNQLALTNWQPANTEISSIELRRESLKRACGQARTTQQALSAGGRLFWMGNDGIRVWLDADTRATQGALAEEIIRLAC
jgi:hypothetical protein